MSKSSNDLSKSFTACIELRIERIERQQNSLEARLISITSLMRSQYNKIESAGDMESYPLSQRLEAIEQKIEKPLKILENLEFRIKKLESDPAKEFFEALHKTQEKIKACMNELKENLEDKEKKFTEKVFMEIGKIRGNDEGSRKKNENFGNLQVRKNDEIENIIQELQKRIDDKEEVKSKSRSESFSILRNSSCNNSQKKNKKKVSGKRVKKVKFND